MTTLQEFIDEQEITAEVAGIDERTDGLTEWGEGARHFRVTLHRELDTNDGDEWISLAEVEFSQGSGWTTDPTAAEVLHAITSDVASMDDYAGAGAFETWAEDYGYDSDSRRAERAFLAIRKQRADLLAWLGENRLDELIHRVSRIDE